MTTRNRFTIRTMMIAVAWCAVGLGLCINAASRKPSLPILAIVPFYYFASVVWLSLIACNLWPPPRE